MNNQIDLNTIMSYMIMIMMIGMMMKIMTRELRPAAERPLIYGPRGEVITHHSSSEVRRLGIPRSEEERARVHEEFYGTGELPARGTGLIERGESAEGRGLGEPKTAAERRETHRGIYGTGEPPERGKGRKVATIKCPICGDEIEVREYDRITRSEALRKHLEEKHGTTAHSIHGPERQRLVDEFGSWAIGRAESVCPEDDIECVRREAGRLIYAYRRSFTG